MRKWFDLILSLIFFQHRNSKTRKLRLNKQWNTAIFSTFVSSSLPNHFIYPRSISFQMTNLSNRFIQLNRSKTFYYASVFMRVLYFYYFLFFLYLLTCSLHPPIENWYCTVLTVFGLVLLIVIIFISLQTFIFANGLGFLEFLAK